MTQPSASVWHSCIGAVVCGKVHSRAGELWWSFRYSHDDGCSLIAIDNDNDNDTGRGWILVLWASAWKQSISIYFFLSNVQYKAHWAEYVKGSGRAMQKSSPNYIGTMYALSVWSLSLCINLKTLTMLSEISTPFAHELYCGNIYWLMYTVQLCAYFLYYALYVCKLAARLCGWQSVGPPGSSSRKYLNN